MATVVTGTAADDVHVIGIRLVEMALRRAGHRVISLGTLVSTREFVDAVIESNADAILVSSLNGHAQLTMGDLREALVEAGRTSTLIYAGGQLTIGRPPWDEVVDMFRAMGVDRVYHDSMSLDQMLHDLEFDISVKESEAGR
jgi:methylaspartate mutase sigma subunit